MDTYDLDTIRRIQRQQFRPFVFMAFLVFSVILGFGFFMSHKFVSSYQDRGLLRKEGIVVTGSVVRKVRIGTQDSASPFNYFVFYRFVTPDGRSFNGYDSSISHHTFDSLQEGGPVVLDYVRSDPAKAFIRGDNNLERAFPVGVAISAFWILISGAIWFWLLQYLLKR